MRTLLRGLFQLLACVSLLSASACAQVLKGSVPPTGSTILLPEEGFSGGVLTGVVVGPDDKPVPNTPVNIAGGVPAVLTGEVVGEEVPKTTETNPPCGTPAAANRPDCATVKGGPPQLPPVQAPRDCATLLRQAQGILSQPG